MPKPVFPRRFASLLRAAGVSISDLAASSGLSRQSIHQLLNGERQPTWETVKKLAAALSVATDAFK